MFDPSKIYELLKNIPKSATVWVAYSGGLDSRVLLQVLVEYRRNIAINLQAVYINHNLNPQAVAWSEHCQRVCSNLQVAYRTISVDAQALPGESPEAAARNARYTALAKLLGNNDYLLTAHHQDDQAETLLLQLFRGAGPKGLAAMPSQSRLGTGYLLRPLLHITRQELLAYAIQHKLNWIEDDSNQNLRFDRNFIRQQLIPVIKQRWPKVTATLSRVASHCVENNELITELAEENFKRCQGKTPHTLNVSMLQELNPVRQKQVIRFWLQQLNFPLPSTKQLLQIQNMLSASKDARPKVCFRGTIIRRYADVLYVDQLKNYDKITDKLLWDITKPFALPNHLGVLSVISVIGQGIACSSITNSQLIIRFRQGGERCQPAGRVGSHPLKKLFQEWRIPPWQRDQVPLLYYQKKIVAVVGYCVCEDFATKPGELGWEIRHTL